MSFLEFAFGAEPDSPTRTLPVADQEEDGLAHDLELLVAAPGDGALPGLEERIVRYFRHRWALWTLP